MTKDYQRKSNNPYLLPKSVYNRALWVIRDYERMRADYENIAHERNGTTDGQPNKTGIGNPTEAKAIRMEQLSRDMEAVEQALLLVPEDLRDGIMNNICYWVGYPHYLDRTTWWRVKVKFVHNVAKNLKLI